MEGRCVEHAEKHRYAPVLVRDDREIHLRLLRLIDIRDPARMVLGAVDAQANDLDAAFAPLGLQLSRCTELGCTYRREVCRMGEEHDQELPMNSWKLIGPVLVSAVKSGT